MKLEAQANKDVFPCQRAVFGNWSVQQFSATAATRRHTRNTRETNSTAGARDHQRFTLIAASVIPAQAGPCQICAAVY